VNDDLSFDAFPFDFDFTDSFPVEDFTEALVTNAPGIWDWLDDLFGLGLDIFGFIGEAIKGLWGLVWEKIGGGLRWVWNRIDDTFDWLGRQLYTYFEWVGGFVNAVALWTWSSASDAGRGIYGGIAGGLGWVAGKVDWWGGAVRDWVQDWAEWVGGKVSWWGGAVRDWVQDWAEWVGGKVSWWGGAVRDWVQDRAGWVAGKVEWWGGAVRDWVQDWAEWSWSRASDAYFGITGGVVGGLVWVRDQVLPAVAGAAMNIVGGITGGFDRLGDILMGPFEFLGDRIVNGFMWILDNAFEPSVDLVRQKLSIAPRLIRGEFDTFEEFWEAVLDPIPVLGMVGIAIGAMIALNAINMATGSMITESIEPMVQRHRALIGTRTLFVTEARDLLLRGEIDEGIFIDHMGRQGYSEANARHLMTLAQNIPGSGDLVRFAVRESFDRSKAEDLGFITPLPGDFALWMERQGYSTEWSERYWWAHWDLPSVTQGFEMLHRGVIEETDLEGLLIALDIPPKWIPRLLDVSYSPITRVDLRRLWQKGFIDEARLERGYRDIGYNVEDARALTDWTKVAYPRAGEGPPEDLRALTLSVIKQAYVRRIIERGEALDRLVDLEYTEEDAELTISIWDFDLEWNPSLRFEVPFKDLSRSVVTDAYRRGVFDFNRAAVELVEAGYTQDDAELLLQLEDLKLQSQLTDMEIDLILQDARAQDITLAEAETRLLGLGLEPARVTFLVRQEELRRLTKTRTLTVSQISRAYREGIFSEGVFLEKVGALGYTADDAAVLLGLEGPVEQAKRQLSRSEVEKLLRRQEITPADALARLTAMGYLAEDAELVVGSVERQLERALVERLLEQQLLTRAEALGRLVKVGFSSADAELIVTSREQKMAEAAAEPEPEETPSRELSRTLVEKFLREGLLDREQSLERLVRAGFTPGDAELIVLSVERKLAEESAEV